MISLHIQQYHSFLFHQLTHKHFDPNLEDARDFERLEHLLDAKLSPEELAKKVHSYFVALLPFSFLSSTPARSAR